MLAITLFAQVVAAASPAPSPPPTHAAAVGSASTAVSAKPRTLADVARERKLGKKGVEGGTFSIAGAEGTTLPVGTTAGGDLHKPSAVSSPAADRVRAANAEVQAARRALDDAATKKGMTSEDAA